MTLVGRSGSGKSSVVLAGLIPALRRRRDGRTWAVLTLRPGAEPLHALVRAFNPPPADMAPFEADQRVKRQVEILRQEDGRWAKRVRALLAAPEERGPSGCCSTSTSGRSSTPRRCGTRRRPEAAVQDVERFIDLVLDAARASPCTVLLTVRADFYGDLLRHGGLATAVPPGLVDLGRWAGRAWRRDPRAGEGGGTPVDEPWSRRCWTRSATTSASCRCSSTR